jgi:hypothetical protein
VVAEQTIEKHAWKPPDLQLAMKELDLKLPSQG